jgi:opacity protein-like surface antigen
MKKRIIALSACAAALAAPQAFAQAANFQGFSAGIGVNIADTRTEFNNGGPSFSGTDTDNNAFLQLQYNAALSDNVVLGFGGTVGLGDLKAGKPNRVQDKQTDSYSLYVAPGYAFNDTWLGYGKIAYINGKLKDERGNSVNFDDGYAYGLGVQVLFNKHWYGQAEIMRNEFSDRHPVLPTNTVKLRSDVYSFAVGYKF